MVFKNFVNILIDRKIQQLNSNKDPYLMNGSMGLAVFLSILHKKTNCDSYLNKAKELLDGLSNDIQLGSVPLEIFRGLCGIGLGVVCLHAYGVIKEDPDIILNDIDNYIYKKSIDALSAYDVKYENTYLDILLYISIRFQHTHSPEEKEIFCKLWFALYNKLYQNLTPDFFIEPIPSTIKYKMAQFILVSALGVILDIKFKERISKIFNEISNFIFSYIPQLHFNRLILFASVKQILNVIDVSEKWHNYQDRLFSMISIKNIIENEILPNDLYLSHGLPCLYYLLKELNIFISQSIVDLIIAKIKKSDLAKFDYFQLVKSNFNGLDGIFSVILMLIELKPNLLNEEN